MSGTKNFTTLFTYNTRSNADTVEWCPIPPYQNYFVCGTYCCTVGPEGRSIRTGSIILFRFTKKELKEVCRLETSAILDMRWCPVLYNNAILLGTATGNGDVCIYRFTEGTLKFVSSINLNNLNSEDYLILSIDWPCLTSGELICCSDSRGYVTVIKYGNGTLTKLTQWNAHNSEVWSACFDSFNSNVVFSGGDDNKLNVWDTRCTKPLRIGRTEKHSSGVTAVSSHPYLNYTLVSGSYDETLLLWDTRRWKVPAQEMISKGGLWRLKWIPRRKCHEVLAACIFAGFEIFNPFIKESVASYKEHESLAYGVDWCHFGERNPFYNGQNIVALCSFYDHKLSVCLWDEEEIIIEDFVED